jgi:hypothetical protein
LFGLAGPRTSGGGQTLFDRDIKELLFGFCALAIFAVVLVSLQQ